MILLPSWESVILVVVFYAIAGVVNYVAVLSEINVRECGRFRKNVEGAEICVDVNEKIKRLQCFRCTTNDQNEEYLSVKKRSRIILVFSYILWIFMILGIHAYGYSIV